MTVAKHYGFNQQETRRNTYDALVDGEAKALYYKPYKGAIDAGCLALMCAYNSVNGHHACASDELLGSDLRDGMAFKGLSFPTGRRRTNTMLAWTWRCRGRASTIRAILGAGTLLSDLVIWMRRL